MNLWEEETKIIHGVTNQEELLRIFGCVYTGPFLPIYLLACHYCAPTADLTLFIGGFNISNHHTTKPS